MQFRFSIIEVFYNVAFIAKKFDLSMFSPISHSNQDADIGSDHDG